MPREGPRPPRERARDDARARLAFLLIACLSVTCAGAEDASASASASAAAWTPPICGGISADDCAASLLAWEKDVRALQSLHRSCGGGNEWPGAWAPVPSFNGTLDDWKALCGAEGASSEGAAELACDADGRIATLRWKQSVKLSCPEIGFPEAFADLTELRVLEMRGAFTTGKMLVSRLLSATTTLTLKKLTTIDLGGNSLAGAPPSMCDVGAFASGAAATLTTLRLNDNALTGPPPAAFASCLSSLEELDVSDNDLTGQLPDAWAAMGALQTLRASDNARLGGVVPPAWFADRSAMNALQTIEMRRCGLSGPIPPGIFNATDAKVIDLRENALNGSLPAAAAATTRHGAELFLARNDLAGVLPSGLFANDAVKTIDVAGNAFNGSLPNITGAALQHLDVSSNHFTGLFPTLGGGGASSTPQMTFLSVSGNALTGSIPPSLSSLTKLQEFRASDNALTGAFPDVSALRYLRVVDVSGNALESGLGAWLESPKLTRVNFARNVLRQSLPSKTCGINLETLDLRENFIHGQLPDSIGDCARLRELHLSARATGNGSGNDAGVAIALPNASAWSTLANLTDLTLLRVGLNGTLPSSLLTLPAIQTLDASHNALSGTLPAVAAGSLTTLRTLTLNDNALDGEVPASLLAAPSLETLRLSDNRLTGIETPAPGSSSSIDVSGVTSLYLAGNNLTSFPSALQNATSLTALDLSDNALEGSPPPWLGRASTLVTLRLGGNKITGALDHWLANNTLIRLHTLSLEGNVGITGPLSAAAIANLSSLAVLNVAGIQTFGDFPAALGAVGASLGALRELTASRAGLTGSLPSTLFAALPVLERLDLSNNALRGSIPRDDDDDGATRHSELVKLFLNDNAFDGTVPSLPASLLSAAASDPNGAAHVVNLTSAAANAAGFECPLPSAHVAYAGVACECAAGRFGSDLGRLRCDPCDAGTFSAAAGAATCEVCAAGTHASARGATACEACGVGVVAANPGSTECVACESGNVAVDASTCATCPAGYEPNANGTSCVACAPGYHSSASSACITCAPGTRAASAAATTCDACAPGTYQNAAGAASCAPCPVGTYRATEGASSLAQCLPCSSGSHSNATGAASCALCPAHQHAPEDGATSCVDCASGAAGSASRASCECLPGYETKQKTKPSSGDDHGYECVACEPGTHATHRGSSSCALCVGKTFAPNATTATCAALSSGNVGASYLDPDKKQGARAQVPCAPGTYAKTTVPYLAMVSTCEACPDGTVSANNASTRCASCRYGSEAAANKTTCVATEDISEGDYADYESEDDFDYGGGGGGGGATGGDVFASVAMVTLAATLCCCACFGPGWWRRRMRRLKEAERKKLERKKARKRRGGDGEDDEEEEDAVAAAEDEERRKREKKKRRWWSKSAKAPDAAAAPLEPVTIVMVPGEPPPRPPPPVGVYQRDLPPPSSSSSSPSLGYWEQNAVNAAAEAAAAAAMRVAFENRRRSRPPSPSSIRSPRSRRGSKKYMKFTDEPADERGFDPIASTDDEAWERGAVAAAAAAAAEAAIAAAAAAARRREAPPTALPPPPPPPLPPPPPPPPRRRERRREDDVTVVITLDDDDDDAKKRSPGGYLL